MRGLLEVDTVLVEIRSCLGRIPFELVKEVRHAVPILADWRVKEQGLLGTSTNSRASDVTVNPNSFVGVNVHIDGSKGGHRACIC